MDRIDMQIGMTRLTKEELLGVPDGECSHSIRRRVQAARSIQAERYGSERATNASAPHSMLKVACRLSTAAEDMLGNAVDVLSLTGRGMDRILRVARTVADLGGAESVEEDDVAEALSFRMYATREEVAA
jgi:magnesium chelatase family protein